MSQLSYITSEEPKKRPPSKWRGMFRMLIRFRLAILIAMAFYRLIGLGICEMQQWGESVFALRVQTILRFGDLWDQSPHMLSGIAQAIQPPLYVWLSASSVLMFGDELWAYRLPSALAAAALVILLYRFARMSMSSVRALIVAGFMAFAPLPVFLSRQGLPDMLLAFSVAAALYFSWHAIRDGSRGALLLAGLALGAALLTRSAYALTVPVAIAVAGALFPHALRSRAWSTAILITLISLPVWLPWTWSMTTEHGGGDVFRLLSSDLSFAAAGDTDAMQTTGLLTLTYRLAILLTLLLPTTVYFLWIALYERLRPLWTLVAVFVLTVFMAEWMSGTITDSTFIPLLPFLFYAGVHGWTLLRLRSGKLPRLLSVPALLIVLALLSVFTVQHIWRVHPVALDDGADRAAAELLACDAQHILLVGSGENPQLTWQLGGADIGWVPEVEMRYERLEPFALGVETIRARAEGYADTMRVAMLVERDEIAQGVYREASEVLPADFELRLQTRRYIVAGSRSVRWTPDSAVMHDSLSTTGIQE